jgi:hypothetical protein
MSDADTGSMNEHARHALGIDHSEAESSHINAKKVRGRPFGKDNPPPGRPKGSRHRTTLAAQVLLDGEAQALTRLCVDRAFAGDPVALKLCMERILPPRKELPIEFTMPSLQSGADTTAVMVAIIQAVSEGKILLSQALDFAKLLHLYSQTARGGNEDDLSTLTDEELRARILRAQARAAVDINWHEEGEAVGPRSG